MEVTPELISAIFGVLLSLAFSYIPKLNVKFAELEATTKRLIMLGGLAVISAVIYGMACAGWAAEWGIALTCDRAGLVQLLTAFGAAMIANQSAYMISPQASAVKEAKFLAE